MGKPEIIRGGWLQCQAKGNKFHCNVKPMTGHIIPNKGGGFLAETVSLDGLKVYNGVSMFRANGGLDQVIECAVFNNKDAQCEVIR